tara:strand:+ start:147 stop:857 length:711 start_codon:yes stop_codon:yes gene_type:complete
MVDFLRPKNYPIMVSPNLKHAWVNIPKNCSSFIQKILYDNDWTIVQPEYAENYIDLVDSILSSKSVEKIVILRDPVQRWISGFAETFGIQEYRDSNVKINLNDLFNLLSNDAWWKIVYQNPVMCHHTEVQHRFIWNAKNVKYIKMQDKNPIDQGHVVTNPNKFFVELSNYISYTGGTSDFQNWKELINPAHSDKNKLLVYNKILECIKNNKNILDELKNALYEDYNLFYNLEKFKR